MTEELFPFNLYCLNGLFLGIMPFQMNLCEQTGPPAKMKNSLLYLTFKEISKAKYFHWTTGCGEQVLLSHIVVQGQDMCFYCFKNHWLMILLVKVVNQYRA